MNNYQEQISMQMNLLTDAIVARPWISVNDVDVFVNCIMSLEQLDQIEDCLSPNRATAFSNALLVFALGASEDPDGTWDELLDSAKLQCEQRHFLVSDNGVSEQYITALKKLINEPSNENQHDFNICWDYAVWEDGDYDNDINPDSLMNVTVTAARIIGLVVVEMSTESRQCFVGEIRDLAGEIEEFREDYPADEQSSNLNFLQHADGERPELSHDTKRKWQARNRSTTNDNRAPKTPETNNAPGQDWQITLQIILAKRNFANKQNNKFQCRPFAANAGANYLAEAVARVIHLAPMPKGMSPKLWASQNPDQVIVIDSSLVLSQQREGATRVASSAIKGRLISMGKYFAKSNAVGVVNNHMENAISFKGELIEHGAAVVLYRKSY